MNAGAIDDITKGKLRREGLPVYEYRQSNHTSDSASNPHSRREFKRESHQR